MGFEASILGSSQFLQASYPALLQVALSSRNFSITGLLQASFKDMSFIFPSKNGLLGRGQGDMPPSGSIWIAEKGRKQ